MPNSKGHLCTECNRVWYSPTCEARPDSCDGLSVQCPVCGEWDNPAYHWFYVTASVELVDSQVDGGW